MKWKNCLMVLIIIIAGCTNSNGATKADGEAKVAPTVAQENEVKEKSFIEFGEEILRVGDYDPAVAASSDFDYNEYKTSALTKIDKETSQFKQPISIDWHKDAEIEIFYSGSIDIEKSEWNIKPDKNNTDTSIKTPKSGRIVTYKIEETRAIAKFNPWVYVPFGNGGETELQFNYVLLDGTKGSKVWKFTLAEME